MAYGYFDSIVTSLERIGVHDVLLPFLLIFTLVFSVLEKTKILGVKEGKNNKPKTNLNTIVSLVMGMGVIIPHVTNSYPPGRDVVVLLNTALPGIAMIVVAIFSFLLLIGMFTGKQPNFLKSSAISTLVLIFSVGAVIAIFVDAANIYRMPRWLYFLQDPNTQAAFIVIVVFFGLVWFITRDDDSPSNDGNKMMDQIRDFLGGN